MASNIVFTVKAGAGNAFTLFGTQDAGEAASLASGNSEGVFTQINMSAPDPWEKVIYAGFDFIDAKFMGARTNVIAISGFMVDDADNEGELVRGIRALLRNNKQKTSWLAKLGGVDLTDVATGAIIQDIIANDIGEGTGPRWPFKIIMKNIGPDADTP